MASTAGVTGADKVFVAAAAATPVAETEPASGDFSAAPDPDFCGGIDGGILPEIDDVRTIAGFSCNTGGAGLSTTVTAVAAVAVDAVVVAAVVVAAVVVAAVAAVVMVVVVASLAASSLSPAVDDELALTEEGGTTGGFFGPGGGGGPETAVFCGITGGGALDPFKQTHAR